MEWLRRKIPFDPLSWYLSFLFVAWINYHFSEKLDFLVIDNNGIVFAISLLEAALWLISLILAECAIVSLLGGGQCLRICRATLLCISSGLLYLDFICYQWVAMHIPTAVSFLLADGLKGVALNANITGVPVEKATLILGCGALLICICAAILVRLDRLASKRSFCIQPKSLLGIGFAGLAALYAAEHYELSLDAGGRTRREHLRAIPTSFSLVRRNPEPLLFNARLVPKRTEPLTVTNRSSLPDIYFIVIESLRVDAITRDVAPAMSAFRDDCVWPKESRSSGNATHISWYSLFTSDWPLYLRTSRNNQTLWGSRPLKAFRDAGYEIHVCGSSYLRYYDLDRIIFGGRRELADSFFDADDMLELSIPDRDREVTKRVAELAKRKTGGRVFILSYDSTHHGYSFPENFKLVRTPCAESWEYTQVGISPSQAAALKNRYLNALAYVDSLFGEFIADLKQRSVYEHSIIFLTGDHGEEFGEHGVMGHSSDFCEYQTHVPLLFKFPDCLKLETATLVSSKASHADVLPTLLDSVGIPSSGQLDGESLFGKTNACVLIAGQNGPRDPSDFCVECGTLKLSLSYKDAGGPIALQDRIYLTKLSDSDDRPIWSQASRSEILEAIQRQNGEFLRRLYPQCQIR